jgi:hypothetical protein
LFFAVILERSEGPPRSFRASHSSSFLKTL